MGWADMPKRPSTADAVLTGSALSDKAVSILARSMSPRWCSPSSTCQATAATSATSPRSADERDRCFADSTLSGPGVSPCSPQSFEPSFPPADEETTGESDCFASLERAAQAAQPLSEVRTRIDAIAGPTLKGPRFLSEMWIRSTCDLCVLAAAPAFQAASAYLHSSWPSSKSHAV